ncbi:pilus assembly protein [Cellvibrio japonicus]|uniref:Putative fimbrial protein n=1 Tax=Cellvibrio japonicus (strain Ueda107) TaxID=498211 RepID=B3PE08_CELJU|nr:PilC/PilY family type IV pilus protein [Cellvibrio japonicus]ACE85541.1 putative fimbrial protein [Cellvibrio japonicus Ueda107]QEI13491.1 hypothetical protein FY117_15495 [Cellvibrio japonicus]QEI17065.1 hypothetical protein FY116_15500 [Cellvibrio japonicus]QEI20643.1 hypothetical protein FY115_15495 [Cellvibrio japonicus]
MKNFMSFNRAVFQLLKGKLKSCSLFCMTGLLTLGVVHGAHAIPSQDPLFLSNPVIPIMMLNMSNDHQLFFKIYDDYADITNPTGGDPDGNPDTTYNNAYNYYGYFDSGKCYTYNTVNNRFVPSRAVNNLRYCNYSSSSEWSGNFLNWATMTRIDAIRKMLYGGLRSTDTQALTVLERSFLPNDAHSFAKFYDGNDIGKLTPFNSVPSLQGNTSSTGITICNTTNGGSALSQNVTAAPLIRVAKGNYSLWASNERWQCQWISEVSASNGNVPASSGIYAYPYNPINDNKLGTGSAAGEYYARVEVCVKGLEEDNCTLYPSGNKKPTGLLQKYGEANKIHFGLMTGSYGKNKSGGVLRKSVGNLSTEVNAATTGTFTNAAGVISTLNKLRIYGYRFDDGTYHRNAHGYDSSGSDGCLWGRASFSDGHCSNWGNPQAEIYLESLRYLTGKTANTAFDVDDSSRISGLSTVSWGSAPVNSNNYCAPLNVVQFNASTTSYDGDTLGAFSDFSSGGVDLWTDKVGINEGMTDKNELGDFKTLYFIGENGADKNQLCTAKTISKLSSVRGTCPDAPRLEGSYHIAGLAYYARQNDLMPSLKGKQTVRTFGVALSPAVPKVTVTVPGGTDKVTILPACRNKYQNPNSNCAIVDFKFAGAQIEKTIPSGTYSGDRSVLNGKAAKIGKLYVNWEDSEQGGDYDQDMWGVIDYIVTADHVLITTDTIAESTDQSMGFGYVISGTTVGGFNVHSGVEGYTGEGCNNCQVGDAATYRLYTVGSSPAQLLETPLYYAAKWGGYSDAFESAAQKEAGSGFNQAFLDSKIKARDTSDSYYFATDPRELEKSLDKAFSAVAAGVGSASAVATSSTRLSEGAYVYQAQFNSERWSGVLNAFKFDNQGGLPLEPTVSTENVGAMPKSGSGRTVYTYNGIQLVNFAWDNLDPVQQKALQLPGELTNTMAQYRVDWLLGNATYEGGSVGFRERGSSADGSRNILGDIVNSSPVYSGAWNHQYHLLPGSAGASYRTFLENVKKPKIASGGSGGRIYVGANDGMLHAFHADTLKEIYAYIPASAFPKLANLTKADYGKTSNPHQFIVDGPVTVGDVYINGEWRTVLVGTLGAGGKGVYALDVTTDVPKVLFELNESNTPGLGYVMGRPLIVPMSNGRFAAVFGNGSDSGSTSSLFVVDIQSPFNSSYTKVINTGEGIGLSAPELMINAYGQVTAAYAGDISGNLWRFDLSSDSAGSWKKDYLLFKAVDASGAIQPITAAPTIGINAQLSNAIMVYVGTGKYYDTGDNSLGSVTHSYYAIADTKTTLTRNNLHRKQLSTTYNTTTANLSRREVVGGNPDWSKHKGWYLDFNDTKGERVTTKALLIQDKLIFPTLIPSTASCEYGGSSWLMEVVAVGDKFVGVSVLDDNIYNGYLVLGDVSFGVVPKLKESDSSSSGSSSSAPSGDCVDGASGTGAIVGSGTDATRMNVEAKYSQCGEGRQSWRQLR